MTSKDRNKRTNVNHKLLKKIFSALEGVDIKQSKFMSKNQKEIKPEDTMPFPSRNVQINYGKGLDYIYGTKPLSNQADYPEGLNPFASALQKIKPSAGESETLSWFKSAMVEAENVNELHKVIDQALASGERINACNDGEWRYCLYRQQVI